MFHPSIQYVELLSNRDWIETIVWVFGIEESLQLHMQGKHECPIPIKQKGKKEFNTI